MMTDAQESAWTPERPTPDVEVSRTYWSDRIGMKEGDVRKLVERLVAIGRATVTHPGDRRSTKRIRLLVDIGDPVAAAKLPPSFPRASPAHGQPETPGTSESDRASPELPPSFPQKELTSAFSIEPASESTHAHGPASGPVCVEPEPQLPLLALPAPKPVDLEAAWTALTAWTPKPAAWKLTADRRKHLTARIADHGEATVYRVAEWVRTSEHDRATFLRGHGDVDTLLRPGKFATYAAMSAGPAPAAKVNGRPVVDYMGGFAELRELREQEAQQRGQLS
jgi:hypothetical protein